MKYWALFVLLAAILGFAGASVRNADAASAVDNLAIDTDPTGNTATSLGTVDDCLNTTAGSTFTIDIVVGPAGIPLDQPLSGFEMRVSFDTGVLRVVSTDTSLLLASNPQSEVWDFSHPLSDGTHWVSAVDLAADADETGPGTIARLTFTAIASGSSVIALTEFYPGSGGGFLFTPQAAIPIQHVGSAVVGVDDPTACQTLDSDGDGVPDLTDNCRETPNADQVDTDGDLSGDACETDDDNDGFSDWDETRFGSQPRNPLSTPENYRQNGFDFTTCLDGLDNDLDGLTDEGDPGCGGPWPDVPNDSFQDAMAVTTFPFFDNQVYLKASTESGEQLPCGGLGKTTWYKFTAPAETVIGAVDGASTYMAAYSGDGLSNLRLLACDPPYTIYGQPPVILTVAEGETVYFQLSRNNLSGFGCTCINVYVDSDRDGVFDQKDNCPTASNADQADEDGDWIGDACDPTPWHDIALTSIEAPTTTVSERGGTGKVDLEIRVVNLSQHTEKVSMGYMYVLGLPGSCSASVSRGEGQKALAPGKKATFHVELTVACAKFAVPGVYQLRIHATAYHDHAEGSETVTSNNSAWETTELRLR